MIPRRDALRHSPALWGLLGMCVGEVALFVGWNLYDRRAEIRQWVKF